MGRDCHLEKAYHSPPLVEDPSTDLEKKEKEREREQEVIPKSNASFKSPIRSNFDFLWYASNTFELLFV